MRVKHAKINAKSDENTSKNSRFSLLWPLSNRTFRIHLSPRNPAFFRHQPLARRLSGSSRTNRRIFAVLQPQVSRDFIENKVGIKKTSSIT
jgi:hypothetical protein